MTPNAGAKLSELMIGARLVGAGVVVVGVDGVVGADGDDPPPQAAATIIEAVQQAIRVVRMTFLVWMNEVK